MLLVRRLVVPAKRIAKIIGKIKLISIEEVVYITSFFFFFSLLNIINTMT